MNCKECGSPYVQSKIKQLCGECVYKKNHGGKSRQQVQLEKSKVKQLSYEDNLFETNKRNQDKAVEEAKKDLKRTPIKKRSTKQTYIEHQYKLVCRDMDYIREKVCTGCLRYQGGDIRLSHSHIISRQDCHNIGKPYLIYDPNNIAFHCMTFGENKGCHNKWESPTQRHLLADYEENIKYIEQVAPELLSKYKK